MVVILHEQNRRVGHHVDLSGNCAPRFWERRICYRGHRIELILGDGILRINGVGDSSDGITSHRDSAAHRAASKRQISPDIDENVRQLELRAVIDHLHHRA